jgi:hypothetical protein
MSAQKSLSELEIGIRELFRIVIPGAYGVLLILVVAPNSEVGKLANKSIGIGVGFSFFLGLVGYALRPHERWAPYFLHFEKYRRKLNDEIVRVVGVRRLAQAEEAKDENQGHDHVAIYKLFLESKASDVKDRIHYFSSFYYMLVELSLFSLIAAFWITSHQVFFLARVLQHRYSDWIGHLVISVGLVLQAILLCGLTSVQTARSKVTLGLSMTLAASGVLYVFLVCLPENLTYLASQGLDPNPLPLGLLFVAFAFERLGAKQWKQIIEEQVILVRWRESDIRGVGTRNGSGTEA